MRIGLFLAATMLAATPGWAACPDSLRAQAQTAAAANDLPAMERTFDAIQRCNDVELGQWLGRKVMTAHLKQATAGPKPDEALLKRALKYGRSWQLLAMLGDASAERRDYAAATSRYQEALTEIDNRVTTPDAPARDIILAIRKKAEQSGLLSPTYVATTRTRNNENSGLGAISVRGVSIPAVALPVEFVFAQTELTPKGQKAMADMIELINNESPVPTALVIEGHADSVGDARQNLILSRQRAEAVATRLRAGLKPDRRGVRITTAGYGDTRPYKPDDPTAYSKAQRDQMDRRVELRRQ